jgi:CheY-like chemotaxis protein
MKNVLIVDDEETLLLIIESRFEDYKDQFSVLTAPNGKEAIEILESKVIDFVVTDLNMPILDGIELLAHMSAKFPTIPAIAMTAFSTPEVEEKLEKMGTLRIMDKPLNLDLLANTVMKGLALSHQGGTLTCISVSNFLQLIHMEEKTCIVEVHGEEQKRGFLYFHQGELYDAGLGDLKGEPACYEMVAWENAQLYVKDPPRKKTTKRINKGVMSLVLEGLRLKDEKALKKGRKSQESNPSAEIISEQVSGALDQEVETLRQEDVPNDQKPVSIAHNAQIDFIGKIFKVLNSSIPDGKLLHEAFKEIQAIVPFDLAAMMIREKSRSGYLKVLDLMTRGSSTISKGAYYHYQGSIFAEVMKQKTPMVLDDIGSLSTAAEKKFFVKNNLKSCLLVPLFADDIVKGLLVFAATMPGIFSGTQQFTQLLADGFSCIYKRCSLTAEIDKTKQGLDATKQIGRALVSWTFEIDKVLKYAVEMIQKIMNVEAGSLMLKTDDELKVVFYFNIKVKSMKKFRIKIGQGIAGYVAAKGKSVLVNDAKKSSRFFSGIDKQTGFKTRSVLCIPLVSRKKVTGVIQVLNKIDGDFTAGDEVLLQAIADSVSAAMEAASLHGRAVTLT